MGLLNSDVLAGLIDGTSRNYRAVVNNIANVSTPGFRTARVRFTEALVRALEADGGLRRGAAVETQLYHPDLPSDNKDGNNVRLEREIVELNKTVVTMKAYLTVLQSRIRRFRAAIDGR